MSDYMPGEAEFIDTYVSAMSGGCTPIEDPERTAEARRGIEKIRADAWDEGWSAGYTDAVDDEHPQATGRHEPNPHRIEGEA
ncbi:MAG: hypothetical protein ACTILB_16615 [Brevibacterium aurantiacum]